MFRSEAAMYSMQICSGLTNTAPDLVTWFPITAMFVNKGYANIAPIYSIRL